MDSFSSRLRTPQDGLTSSKAQETMNKLDKKFLGDVILILAILLITVVAYVRFNNPAVLLAGSLALTFFVAAEIVLSR